MIKRIACISMLFLGIALGASAQDVNGGLLYASDFGRWQLPQGNSPTSGMIQWPNSSICSVTSGGFTFAAVKIGRPLKIVDVNPAQSEVVTPTSVHINNSTCTVTAPMSFTHLAYTVQSGTAGLQEAIDYATVGSQQQQVVLTPAWRRIGGTSDMITAAAGNVNVTILDQRSSQLVPYLWNGNQYVAAVVPSGAAGVSLQVQGNVNGALAGLNISTDNSWNNLIVPGFVSLGSDPTSPLQAATKQYVDSGVSGANAAAAAAAATANAALPANGCSTSSVGNLACNTTHVGATMTAKDAATFTTAISTLTSGGGSIVINGAVTITSSTSIPSNIGVLVGVGGSFNVSSGQTLTISGPFVSYPLSQIFTGAGTVTFGGTVGVDWIYPQWWGAKPDGTTDSLAALNAAATAAAVLNKTVRLVASPTPYMVSGTWTVPCGVKVLGESHNFAGSILNGSTIKALTGNFAILSIGGTSTATFCSSGVFDGLTIQGNGTQTADLVDVSYAGQMRFRDLYIGGSLGGGMKLARVQDSTFTSLYIHNVGTSGSPTLYPALLITPNADGNCNNLTFVALDLEAFSGPGLQFGAKISGNGVAEVTFSHMKAESQAQPHGVPMDLLSGTNIDCYSCHVYEKNVGSANSYSVHLSNVSQFGGDVVIEMISGTDTFPTQFAYVENSNNVYVTSTVVGASFATYSAAGAWVLAASNTDVSIQGGYSSPGVGWTIPIVSPNVSVYLPQLTSPVRQASQFKAMSATGSADFIPYFWFEDGANADEKGGEIRPSGNTTHFRFCTDSHSTCNDWMSIARTGATPTAIALTGTSLTFNTKNVAVPTMGTAVLVAGTVTVSNAAACGVGSNCVYKLTRCAANSSTAIGSPSIGATVGGTSFVINSLSATNTVVTGDLSTVCWQIN